MSRPPLRYLKTETDLARELGIAIPHPIRLFDLEGIGIDRAQFLGDLAPSFRRLRWDTNDVIREQVAFLLRKFPEHADRLVDFRQRYTRDATDLRELTDLFRLLDHAAKRKFELIRSYRRRSIAQFVLTKEDTAIWQDEWRVQQTHCHGFRQHVHPDDVRSEERIFDPTADDVIRHSEFQALLVSVAVMVEEAEATAGRTTDAMTLTFHQMSLLVYDGALPTNAPEGVHRDGADYIVSALVIEREDVEGGESHVLSPTRDRPYLTITLQPGQGLFQADMHHALPPEQQLWHDVTPIRLRDTNGDGEGYRNIFGFDIAIARR
ncbi:2OG-Fe dioxygenase family protein [Candidatus Uhrbacteria bacterium]|nr:2OG-Fe dioxygenase family protein [Candidatus Uhrbacteria bacterium]